MVSVESLEPLASVLTPLVIFAVGGWYNYHLYRKERRDKQRIEFTVDAEFYGPKEKRHLAEFLIHVHNRSHVRYRTGYIGLRLLGLKQDDTPAFWDESERSSGRTDGPEPITVPEDQRKRLEFPHEILDRNVLPYEVFIEPDVDQPITFVTAFEEEYEYVLARAEFVYADTGFEPHTAERLFEPNAPDAT